MIEHHGPISGIAVFSDKYVLTAGYDNQVILWDQESKTSLTRGCHDHLVNQVAISPDGQHAVTSSSDHGARLWRLPDLRLVSVLADHEDDVEMSVFHPTRQLIATASRDHNVRVFSFSGNLVVTLRGHTADVISVEWSRDGLELISSSDDGTVKRWSLASGDLVDDIDMGGIETDTIAIASDGTVYAGNDEGQIIRIADTKTTIDAHEAGIKRLILDDTRSLLVSLSYDRCLRIWDVTGAEITLRATADLPADVWPRSAAFAGKSHLVLATFGSSYRTYDYVEDAWLEESISATQGINAVGEIEGLGVVTVGDAGELRSDGKLLASVGSLCNFLVAAGNTVLTGGQLGAMIDALTTETVYQHRSPLNCGVVFDHDGREHVLIGSYTGEGLVFDVSGVAPMYVAALPMNENAIKGVAYSGGLLFSVAADASATWYDAATLKHLKTIDRAHDMIANGCASLTDGSFASVSRDLKLRIWDPQMNPSIIDTPHDHSIKCVAASADGRYIATGGYHGRIAVYDRKSGRWVIDCRPTMAGISSLASNSVRPRFLASSYDGQVYEVAIGNGGPKN